MAFVVPRAWEAVTRVFEVADAAWRGIGRIPMSGLVLREEFATFDAARRYGIRIGSRHHSHARSGQHPEREAHDL